MVGSGECLRGSVDLLAFVGSLWVVGVVLLVGAVIGRSVTLGGTELPALTTPKVRVAVAGIGVFALVLGMLLYVPTLTGTGSGAAATGRAGGPPSSASAEAPQPPGTEGSSRSATPTPTPSPSPDAPSPEEDSTPTASSSTTEPKPSAPTVRVRWQGTLLLYSNGAPTGWWLDNVPPTPATIGDLGLECDCHPGEVVANAIAAWDGSQPPKYQQCSALSGQLARRALAVQEGAMACLKTWDGRLGYFTVTSMPGPSELNVAATIWDRR